MYLQLREGIGEMNAHADELEWFERLDAIKQIAWHDGQFACQIAYAVATEERFSDGRSIESPGSTLAAAIRGARAAYERLGLAQPG